jgi:hypothetical protein
MSSEFFSLRNCWGYATALGALGAVAEGCDAFGVRSSALEVGAADDEDADDPADASGPGVEDAAVSRVALRCRSRSAASMAVHA